MGSRGFRGRSGGKEGFVKSLKIRFRDIYLFEVGVLGI